MDVRLCQSLVHGLVPFVNLLFYSQLQAFQAAGLCSYGIGQCLNLCFQLYRSSITAFVSEKHIFSCLCVVFVFIVYHIYAIHNRKLNEMGIPYS